MVYFLVFNDKTVSKTSMINCICLVNASFPYKPDTLFESIVLALCLFSCAPGSLLPDQLSSSVFCCQNWVKTSTSASKKHHRVKKHKRESWVSLVLLYHRLEWCDHLQESSLFEGVVCSGWSSGIGCSVERQYLIWMALSSFLNLFWNKTLCMADQNMMKWPVEAATTSWERTQIKAFSRQLDNINYTNTRGSKVAQQHEKEQGRVCG